MFITEAAAETLSSEQLVEVVLLMNPSAWPGRREEARALLVAYVEESRTATTLPLLPQWLTDELPKQA